MTYVLSVAFVLSSSPPSLLSFHCLSMTVVLPQICIEMADSTGVTQVLNKSKYFSPDLFVKRLIWYACVLLTLKGL